MILLLAALEVSLSRRRLGTAVIASVARPAWADTSWAAGVYRDPNHPNGERRITVDGDVAKVVGVDDVGDKPWTLAARVTDDAITLQLQDGAVQPPDGVTIESIDEGPLARTFRGSFEPPNAILWPDGNRWTKK
mmetsp:Transcript_38570/g.123626  ORF Transcript_38570/g.123626 Transcript_38570/m.123626 type:complete len:134 (+) Transcript_38570:100-501(+)|eukprot:CAMPEP_0118907098 /NCGR_PEP_ID=MMETSP1166-20130328/10694_1 /TAXON_ID=1104430 /ORGANISM="Chrysoreinhardia sp, Strain CCMP3193" /LENGTH=133 /DNA_ID=CAMNT_0006846457 /DNA_START=15 /DNA_END=416 /DNA_ORIENTATION=-